MAGRSKKSTKKFEKNHLKDTLDKRKDFAKIKQRAQIKAKKQARNASDRARAPDLDEQPQRLITSESRKKEGNDYNEMNADEFFQGGFQIPEPKNKIRTDSTATRKRKRQAVLDDEIGSDEKAVVPGGNSTESVADSNAGSESDDSLSAHKGQLNVLATKDPEFYSYLKENDPGALAFEDELDFAELDHSSEDDVPNKKRKKHKESGDTETHKAEEDSTEITLAMVEKWKISMVEQHSLRAMREVVLAFRVAVHVNEEDGKEYKYSISSSEVYHRLLITALEDIPNVLGHHIPAKEFASGKVRVATDTKKYRTLIPLLKTHASSIHHLLETLSDASTIKMTLMSVLALLPNLLSFKKILKNLVKTAIDMWSDSSSTESTRITAFLFIRRLSVISDSSLREAVLKTVYQGLVKGSRSTTSHTLPGVNLMKNSAAELWGLDPDTGYTTAFTSIRALAVHLRSSITHPTKESYKLVYNWQYVHSLDFWSRVVSIWCSPEANPALKTPSSSPLHPLIYPLVQITLGAMRLIPTPAYFPLRFQLVRSLLRISHSTTTYIPLAPALLEVLSSPELKKPPKPSTLKPVDFSTTIRASKTMLRTRIYQDGLGEQVAELLMEFFGVWCKSIAFPELIIPPSVHLKRWLREVNSRQAQSHGASNRRRHEHSNGKPAYGETKGNKNSKVNAQIALVVQKLEANASWIETRRRKVDFAPSNRAGVEGFLRDVSWEDTPLGAFVMGMRKQKEERQRVLEEGRRVEEERESRTRQGVEEDGDAFASEDDVAEDNDEEGGLDE